MLLAHNPSNTRISEQHDERTKYFKQSKKNDDHYGNRKCIPPDTKQSDYPLLSEFKINAPNVSKLLTKGIIFRLSIRHCTICFYIRSCNCSHWNRFICIIITKGQDRLVHLTNLDGFVPWSPKSNFNQIYRQTDRRIYFRQWKTHDDPYGNRKCIPPDTKQSDYPSFSESQINATIVSVLLTKGIIFRLSIQHCTICLYIQFCNCSHWNRFICIIITKGQDRLVHLTKSDGFVPWSPESDFNQICRQIEYVYQILRTMFFKIGLICTMITRIRFLLNYVTPHKKKVINH